MKKILIVTDAWTPQINGVVTTLKNVISILEKNGHDVHIISHQSKGFKTFKAPSYPEIDFVWNLWKIKSMMDEINPEYIHISTEGPLGIAATIYCKLKKIPFTTSYHTKTPEYLKSVWKIPLMIGYSFMRWLHNDSKMILVTTESMQKELEKYKFNSKMKVWSRGVNLDLFKPVFVEKSSSKKIKLLYVGRVSVEKNLEAFFQCYIPFDHKKIVVGDGPMLETYQNKYPEINFLGAKTSNDLVKAYNNADVFVFPSKWDTFGIVMIEANACGIPIAAYPVTGPKDFIIDGLNGFMSDNLSIAITKALKLDKTKIRTYIEDFYSWQNCADIFENTLVKI